MEFSSFTFFVTDDCNFDCSYCYQKKGKKYIDTATIEDALDFFFPLLKEDSYINFYGGEPLLAFDQIKHSVNYLQEKNKRVKKTIKFTLTTNGSLINDDLLRFLSRHRFSVLLSFDGLAQDLFREKASFNQIVLIIDKILKNRDIYLKTNSVFTPETVGYLSRSIQFLVELGVPNIGISPSLTSSWDPASLWQLRKELLSSRGFILSSCRKTGKMPVVHLRKKSRLGIFSCSAGKNRLAMSADGDLWGCHLFLDCFAGKKSAEEYHKYYFGDLNTFIEAHEEIYPAVLANYANLRMSRLYTSETSCILCEELEECNVCPLNNIISGSDIMEIPTWMCELKKIIRGERRLFWKEIEENTQNLENRE